MIRKILLTLLVAFSTVAVAKMQTYVVDIPKEDMNWEFTPDYNDPVSMVKGAGPAVFIDKPKNTGDLQATNMSLFFQKVNSKWNAGDYFFMFTLAFPLYEGVLPPIIKVKGIRFGSSGTPFTRTLNGFAQCEAEYTNCVSIRNIDSHYVIPEEFDRMWVINVPLDESDVNQLLSQEFITIKGVGSAAGQRFEFVFKVPLANIENPLVTLVSST